jgi:hypothetical protein
VKSGRGEREDLSDNFRVQLGRWTEEFNLRWLERSRKVELAPLAEGFEPLPPEAALYRHPGGITARRGRYSARPDAIGSDALGPFLVEAKHVADRELPEDMVRVYLGQLYVSMHVLGLRRAVLSVIYGTERLTAYGVPWLDETWQAIERWIEDFDGHLMLDVEPLDPIEPPYRSLPLPRLTNRWRPKRPRNAPATLPA